MEFIAEANQLSTSKKGTEVRRVESREWRQQVERGASHKAALKQTKPTRAHAGVGAAEMIHDLYAARRRNAKRKDLCAPALRARPVPEPGGVLGQKNKYC